MKQFILTPLDLDLVEWVGTTWELSDEANYANVISDKVSSSAFKGTWFVETSLPIGTTYYVRGKQHLSDDGGVNVVFGPWIEYIGVETVEDTALEVIEPEVAPPYLSDGVSYQIVNDSIEVALLPMRSHGSTHLATNLHMLNSSGEVVYCDLDNRTTPNNITINTANLDIFIGERCKLLISVINSHGVQSTVSEYTILPTVDRIRTKHPMVNIRHNIEYAIALLNPAYTHYHFDIIDRDISESVYSGQSVFIGNLEILIPRYTLEPSKTYMLEIRNDSTGVVYTEKMYTAGRDIRTDKTLEPRLNSVEIPYEFPLQGLTPEMDAMIGMDNIYIQGIRGKLAMYPNYWDGSITFSLFNKDHHTEYQSPHGLTRQIDRDKLNLINIPDRRVAMLGTASGVPFIDVVNYDPDLFIAKLKMSTPLTGMVLDESTGFNSFLYNGLHKRIYFIAKEAASGTLGLYSYGVVDNVVSKLVDLPDQDHAAYTLSELSLDTLLVTNSRLELTPDPANAYIYSVLDNNFILITQLDWQHRNSVFCTHVMTDGNILFVDTAKTTDRYLVFNPHDNTFRTSSLATFFGSERLFFMDNGTIFTKKDETTYHYVAQ